MRRGEEDMFGGEGERWKGAGWAMAAAESCEDTGWLSSGDEGGGKRLADDAAGSIIELRS